MRKRGNRARSRLALPCLAAALSLLSAPAAAQARATASGSVNIEEPVGGSFALDTAERVMTAIFTAAGGSGQVRSAARQEVDFRPVLFSSYVGYQTTTSGDVILLLSDPAGDALWPVRRIPIRGLRATPARMMLFVAQFN